jgi:prepilin peptidase CpaA
MEIIKFVSDILLILILCICVYTDLKSGKIYNKITFSGMILGVLINTGMNKWKGAIFSIEGLFLGILIFIIPFALGGLGAGDVKLVGTIGAIKGPVFVLVSALLSAIAGGIIATFIMLKRKKFLKTTKQMLKEFFNFITLKIPFSLAKEEKEGFPYALAIFLGTILTFILNKLEIFKL